MASNAPSASVRFREDRPTSVDSMPCPTDLKCAICHCTYEKPVMLSCGHSFCDGCARVWLHKQKNCPTCRTDTTDAPIRNIALGQIVDEHMKVISEEKSSVSQDGFRRDQDTRKSRRRKKATDSLNRTPSSTVVRSADNTPLRRMPSDYVYTGPIEEEADSTRAFVRSFNLRRTKAVAPSSSQKGSFLRQSLGRIRRSMRVLRPTPVAHASPEHTNEHDKTPFVRSANVRKSIFGRLFGGKKGETKRATVVETTERTQQAVPQYPVRLILVFNATGRSLCDQLEKMNGTSSVVVLPIGERSSYSPAMFLGCGLSILYKDEHGNETILDFLESSSEDDRSISLISSASGVLLISSASEPASSLQATANYRRILRERAGQQDIPIWSVMVFPSSRQAKDPLFRQSATELSARFLPTKQVIVEFDTPCTDKFTVPALQVLNDLASSEVNDA